jgi:hypothetical protein
MLADSEHPEGTFNRNYHDTQYSFPIAGDSALFERLKRTLALPRRFSLVEHTHLRVSYDIARIHH